jgi:hypothetical protein
MAGCQSNAFHIHFQDGKVCLFKDNFVLFRKEWNELTFIFPAVYAVTDTKNPNEECQKS